MISRSLRFTLAVLLALLLALPLMTQVAKAQTEVSPQDVVGRTLSSLTLDELQGLLQSAGYQIGDQFDTALWAFTAEGNGPYLFVLWDCDEAGRCEGVRMQSRWIIGDRIAAHLAVLTLDASVPIARVHIETSDLGKALFVGRDVWLAPGRTEINLLLQFGQMDQLASAVTSTLVRADPEIVTFWDGISAGEDGTPQEAPEATGEGQ